MSHPMDSGRGYAPELCGFCGWFDESDELTDQAIAELDEIARRELAQCGARRAIELSYNEIAELSRAAGYEGLVLHATPVKTRSPVSSDVFIGAALEVWLPLGITVAATAIPWWAATSGLLVIVGGVLYLLRWQRMSQ